ncbi:hypothetical protein [Fibrella aquatica]|uniref:hypothetical protein n=1 Tax=Fibrella aquatica TaxID=3242487 RepID=UPI0035213D73
MKYLIVILFAVAGLATSCKKTTTVDIVNPNVDRRDRMVGTYAIGYNVVIRIGGGGAATNPESYTGTLGVTKSTNNNELILDFDAPGLKEKLTASLADSTFTILDKKTEPIIVNGTTFVGQFTGSGMFVRDGGQQKVTYSGVSEDPTFRKITILTGTKN